MVQTTLRDYLQTTEDAISSGRISDALANCQHILTHFPEVLEAQRLLGEVYLAQGQLEEAQQTYELSRGNSQIRQEFNQLSEKVGQQGFIFSRAGLARLYMRGDLLPQAIQEWETVLASSPERLDARIGLLEAYWREGLYASCTCHLASGCTASQRIYAASQSVRPRAGYGSGTL